MGQSIGQLSPGWIHRDFLMSETWENWIFVTYERQTLGKLET